MAAIAPRRGNCESDALGNIMPAAIIEQPFHTPAPSTPSVPGAEWGLWGAIAFLSARELLRSFRHKEDSETRLLHSLVESLQISQSHLLKQLVETQHSTNKAINGLQSAVKELGQSIKVETATIARTNHMALRVINARLDRIDGRKTQDDDDDDDENVGIPTGVGAGRR